LKVTKTWLLSLAGLVVFIVLTIFVQNNIQTSANRLDQEIKRIEKQLSIDSWQAAHEQLSRLASSWQRIKPFWSVLLNHREIDSIDQALVKTKKALLSKDLPATQIELGSLRHFLKHVPEREALNLVNVF
jgi:hypothetical protein